MGAWIKCPNCNHGDRYQTDELKKIDGNVIEPKWGVNCHNCDFLISTENQ